jgi:hypothetical protein
LSPFSDVFKGARRNTISGKKQDGLKTYAVLPLNDLVSEFVWLIATSTNDIDILGQLKHQKDNIYVSTGAISTY